MKKLPKIVRWKKFISRMNDKGIPIPMARDPNTLEGSVSLSLVCMSTLLVTVGIVGKWSGHLGGIDIANALQFFYASCTLYFGHSWVHRAVDPVDPVETARDDKKTGDHSD